jgi:hypothetical protein
MGTGPYRGTIAPYSIAVYILMHIEYDIHMPLGVPLYTLPDPAEIDGIIFTLLRLYGSPEDEIADTVESKISMLPRYIALYDPGLMDTVMFGRAGSIEAVQDQLPTVGIMHLSVESLTKCI